MLTGGGEELSADPGPEPLDPELLLRRLPDLVTIVDDGGVVQFVSPAVQELLGYRPEQLLGRQVCEFLDPDGRRNCAAWLAFAERGADLPELAHRVIRADGTPASFETRIRLLERHAERYSVVTVSRDVSTRTAVEERMDDRGRMWQSMIDLVPEGLLVLDEDSTVVAANRAAADLLHAEPSDLCGAPVRQFLEPAVDGTNVRALLSLSGAECPVDEFTVVPRRPGCTAMLRGRATAVPPSARRHARARVLLSLHPAPVRPLAPPGTAGAAIPVTPERPPLPAVDGKQTPEVPPSRDAVSPCEGLSPREIAVLRLLSEGHDVREIANDLGISIHTVRSYVKSILKKLDVRTQLQAVVLSARSGVLDLS